MLAISELYAPNKVKLSITPKSGNNYYIGHLTLDYETDYKNLREILRNVTHLDLTTADIDGFPSQFEVENQLRARAPELNTSEIDMTVLPYSNDCWSGGFITINPKIGFGYTMITPL